MQDKILELKQKAKKEYETKVKTLKAEYDKDINAIDRVFSLMGDEKQKPRKLIRRSPPAKHFKTGTPAAQVVREIINDLGIKFSSKDIKDAASKLTPPVEVTRNILHHVIKMKKDNNEIYKVGGSGKSPAVYKKTDEYKVQ